MNLLQTLWQGATWLALCGMCLPTSVVVGGETAVGLATADPRAGSAIHDVALAPGGLLVGQLMDETMQPMRGASVVIKIDGKTAVATSTDANGVFAATGLRGGMHEITTGESTKHCRLWAPGTAPPQAVANLRYIPGQGDLVRGQWGQPPAYNSFAGQAKALATNPWVIAGVVATAIAVPVALHNMDDDDDNGS
jgi:hypothetical protein